MPLRKHWEIPGAIGCDAGGMSRNFQLIIEYDGTRFFGWQRQVDKPTIQAEIERVLSLVTRQPVILKGSGRTDAGVHAQNLSLPNPESSGTFCRGTAFFLAYPETAERQGHERIPLLPGGNT